MSAPSLEVASSLPGCLRSSLESTKLRSQTLKAHESLPSNSTQKFLAEPLHATMRVTDTFFVLPSAFLGTWQGTPDFNVLGPGFGTNIYHLGVAQAPSGDYFIENNLLYDGVDMGHQRFYIEGSDNPGLLWYCGYLIDFPANNGTELAGAFRADALGPMDLSPAWPAPLAVQLCRRP